VTLLIGTNDVKKGTDLNDYRIAVTQLLVCARMLVPAQQLLLLEIPSFPEGVMYPYNVQMNTAVDDHNKVLNTLAREHGIRTMGLELNNNHLFDGVHLNSEGCKACATQIAELILNDKGLG